MDVYTASNFKKHQSTIFKNILKQKKPVEITVNSANTHEALVLLPKDEYEQLAAIKTQLVAQATSEIQQFALHQKHNVLKTDAEIEAWFNEDE